ncbi:hypothetical protein B0A48_06004 [Cryoendolithus antarcticus]|uniref:MARVEL domain-containing protein n=1 Tax=Cryoendolithus antarcticus TaxID=1507870 RepID=A0A1V8TCL5_9PEZI|nr:hypothetical protein B0A48_06004 [Cryoendolithus antarcticus]
MGIFKGGALRLVQTALYAITFCCSAIILGFFSYFLSVLADRKLTIPTKWKAVEGLAGAAVLYSICAILLTCCLGGVTFFAFLGLFLDVLFIGAMVAIAIMTRDGAKACNGFVKTPIGNGLTYNNDGSFGGNGFGSGNGENVTYAVGLKTACRYNKVCFAVAIIGALFFVMTAFMQVFLARHHKKEKRYGPGPKNNYTSGTTKRKFWQRKPKTTRDAEMGSHAAPVAGGLAVPATHHNRASHETGYTGSTVAAPHAANAYDKDGNHTAHTGTHGEYHNQPHNAGVNPYGYDAPATGHHYAPHTGTATNY